MNLIGESWVPVVDARGVVSEVGLKQLFNEAADLRDLALNAPQRVSVMRLLLCIAHAALDGPKDEDDWRACRDRIVPESLRYLNEWRESFDLFGKKPFLQVKDLIPSDNATHDKLDFSLAAGNNHVLFDHAASTDGRSMINSRLAMQLLTYQVFSPGGLTGETKWAGKNTGRSCESAPCLEGSPLLTLLRGKNLLTSIHANLIAKDQLDCTFGRPVWEKPPKAREGPSAEAVSASYLGRLVPLSRGVLFGNGGSLTLVNGLSFPKLPVGRDTMATVVLRGEGAKQEHRYIRIDPSQHPWRELASVLVYRGRGKDESGGPPALRNLRSIGSEQIDIWVGGLAANKAKLLDTGEWVFSLPASMIDATSIEAYANGVELARKVEVALKFGVKTYCEDLKLDADGRRQNAVTGYWSRLDTNSSVLLEVATRKVEEPGVWSKAVLGAALESYAQACAVSTPRQIQAFAKGKGALTATARKNMQKEAPNAD